MQIKVLIKIFFITIGFLGIMGCNSSQKKVEKNEILDQQFFEYTGLEEPNSWIFKNEDTWIRLQKQMFQNQTPPPNLESVNFLNENMVVIAFGQKSSGGFKCSVKSYRQRGDTLFFQLKTPKTDPMAPVTMALTQPVIICKVPLTSAKVVKYNMLTE